MNSASLRDQSLADAIRTGDRIARKQLLQWYDYDCYGRKQTCRELARIIREDRLPDQSAYSAKHVAMVMITMLADFDTEPEVIDTLLDNINYHDPARRVVSSIPQPQIVNPALAGLLKIGATATEKIFLKIRSSDDDQTNYLLAYWFSVQFGKRISIVVLDDYINRHRPGLKDAELKRLENVKSLCSKSTHGIP
jgi:hypothetical protein